MQKKKIKYLIMEHLGIRLTTYCNLNCKGCADLIPYTRDCYYAIDRMKQDVDKLLQVVDFVEEVLLIGGEVFIYPALNEALKYVLDSEKIRRVIITTNGTIMPASETLELLKHDKAIVRVSGYEEAVAPNRGELIHMLRTEKIALQDFFEGMNWKDIGNMECRGRSAKEIELVWDKCCMNDCVTMTERGRIYYCSRAIAADDLGRCPKPKEGECVDVRNTPVEQLGEELERFYALPYISTCDYCDGLTPEAPVIPVAVQIVPKYVALGLFEYEWQMRSGKADRESLLYWMEFVQQNIQVLADVDGIWKILEKTLEAFEKDVPQEVVMLWNWFNNKVFSQYTYVVKDPDNVLQKNQYRDGADSGKRKNTILIVVSDGRNPAGENWNQADLIVSPEEIRKEAEWERQTGGHSILRYAFYFEKIC